MRQIKKNNKTSKNDAHSRNEKNIVASKKRKGDSPDPDHEASLRTSRNGDNSNKNVINDKKMRPKIGTKFNDVQVKKGNNQLKQPPSSKKAKRVLPVDDDDESDNTDPNQSDSDNEENNDDEFAQQVDLEEDENENSDEDDNDEEEEDDDNDATGFTDENADWLKPKAKIGKDQLLSSDDEDDNEEEDDEEEMLDIERDAQMLDDEMEEEEDEAEEEMRTTIREHTSIYHLPTTEEMEQNEKDRVVLPPSEMRSHIESILEVLAEFKERREPGRSRQEYIDRLGTFIAELHGYLPELIEYFLTMLSPSEAVEFVTASDKPRPLVIRTNTLKARRKDLAAALIKRGVTLDPLASWSKVGIKIVDSPVPIGATPEYLSGMYMLQSAASMCPVLALSPQPNEKVFDMSAAPGGKTSYIAQLMRNTGVIIANDLKPDRQKATVANMHRLGVKNVITTCYDGRKIGKEFQNRFDRILLDAPCSGLGVISRDPAVKVQRTIADIQQNAQLQKELLLNAIDALKYKNTTGGVMVYSTCSISVYENEEVVQYALNKRDIQIIDTGLDFGSPGFTRYQQKRFHPSVALCKRLYPHTVNMDGFFVCKIKKLSNTLRTLSSVSDDATTKPETVVAEKVKETSDKSSLKGKPTQAAVKSSKGNKNNKKQNSDSDSANAVKPAVPEPRPKKRQLNAKVTKPRRLKPPTASTSK